VQEATRAVAKLSPSQIIKMCRHWLGKYVAEAQHLECENQRILDSMPFEMREVIKRVAGMRKSLIDLYPDVQIVDDMASGFALVGKAPSSSGVLPQKFTPANLHVSHPHELSAGASMARECRLWTKF